MTYLQRTSEKKKNRKKYFVIFSVIIIILAISFWFRKPMANLTHKISFPVNNVANFVAKPFKAIPTYFTSKKKLVETNNKLEEENKMMKIELMSLKALQDKNRELQSLLGFKGVSETLAEESMFARVILTPPFSPFDSLVARIQENTSGGGTNFSLAKGDHIFVKNILVGEINEVYEKSFNAVLYSTYGQTLPVKINNEITAEAKGQGGLSFKIEIPKNLEVSKGDPIYLLEYPDTPVGEIEKINTTEASSFQTIYFKYPFDFSDFTFIEIRN